MYYKQLTNSYKNIILFKIFIFLSIHVQSQNSITIKTSIENINCNIDTFVRNVKILIINNQQAYDVGNLKFKGCIFNYKGKIPKATYKIIISIDKIGKDEYIFDYNNESNLILPTIHFNKVVQLKEVTIIQNTKKMMKVEGDKIVYEVKNNSLLSSGSINDIIRKIPGVIPNPLGSGFSMNGKVTAIYINSIPSSLSGDDLNSYLQSLPASQIDKIEVIKNPGASFDGKTAGGIINIILIATNNPNFFGIFNNNYIVNNNQKINPSFILNYGFKKINIQLNTGFSYIENNSTNILSKQFSRSNQIINFTDSTVNNNIVKVVFFNPIINYQINKKSTLLYQINLNQNFKNQYFTNYTNANIDNIFIKTNNNFKINSTNQEHILNYINSIDSLGQKFNATFYYTNFNKINSVENIKLQLNKDYFGIFQVENEVKNYFIKLDYIKPYFKNKIFYNAGVKFNNFNSTSIGKYNFDNEENTIFQNKTYKQITNFSYTEEIISAYNELKLKLKQLSVNVGVRYENFNSTGTIQDAGIIQKIKNVNFFPSISALYEINNFIKFTSSYSQKYETPSFSQIDPNITGNFNNYSKVVGNPNFKFTIFNNFSLDISVFEYLSIGLDYTTSNNINIVSFIPVVNSYQTIQSIVNYPNFKSTNFHINLPIPFGFFTKGIAYFNNIDIEKSDYLYLSTNFSNSKIGDNNELNNSGIFYVIYSHFALPFNIEFSAVYSNFNGNYQIYHVTKPIQNFSMDISKKINNKLRISFFASDIFNQLETNAGLQYLNLKTNYYLKEDSRSFGLRLSYNFGNNKRKSTVKELNIKNETKKIESSDKINPLNNQ